MSDVPVTTEEVADEPPPEIINLPDHPVELELPGESPVTRGELNEFKNNIAEIINSLADTYKYEIKSLRDELSQMKSVTNNITTSMSPSIDFLQNTINSLISKLPGTAPSKAAVPPHHSIIQPSPPTIASTPETTVPKSPKKTTNKQPSKTATSNKQSPAKTSPVTLPSANIYGSSIIKPVNRWNVSKKTRVCAYPGATIDEVSGHAAVDLRSKTRTAPDIAIFHAGGNDLANGKTVAEVTDDIALAVTKLRSQGVKYIAISSITPRQKMTNIGELNSGIKNVCKTFKIDYIDNHSIRYENHVCRDTIHLNPKGIAILESNYARYISSVQIEKE